MATQPAPEIRVFAMFPSKPQSSKWNWVHCLTFPVNTLNELQFSPKPYKWIRYATGVVVGAQGDLSSHKSLPYEAMDYEQDLPHESIKLYYHIDDDEKQRMFPIDPDMERTTLTGSDVTAGRAYFRGMVVERDQACVLTGWSESFCYDAVHLLPHCKGDAYILAYTTHRSRDPAHNDIVDTIDDIRNGILLHRVTHHALHTHVAFLVTPNFAMSTADVDPALSPTEKRCTAHLFTPGVLHALGDPALRSGAAVRMPATLDQWPPDILFDAVYASTVLSRFASRAIQDALGEWKTTFYPGKTVTGAGASHPTTAGEQAMNDERMEKQKEDRNKRMENRNKRRGMDDDARNDYFDCLMFLPYILVPPKEQEAVWREAAEKRAERERSELDNKVASWARDVAGVCD